MTRDFIQALPKTETHLHIEGAIPYEFLQAWRPDKYPANPSFHAPDYRFPDFGTFEQTLLDHALPWFDSAEHYHEGAKAIFARHTAQNVRYVETSFHLPVTQFINVPGPEIIAAIRAAVPAGLEVRIFAGMLRSDHTGPLQAVIDDLENWEGLAGVDLHGHESFPTEPWTAGVWARLRAAGKVTKCHAGEFDGAPRVEEAIEQLGVKRVQHGVRAIEDPAVLRLAHDLDVTFDVCPISNIRLKVFPDYQAHPLRQILAAGVRCTISTDDPLCFNNSVNAEYLVLSEEMGFTRPELGRMAENGWQVADVTPEFRAANLREIAKLTHE
ncbi:MAG: adenosine deaminase [Cephaloticoccus sp.]|nr:adenosine deaminase [Cephaloticoccus sp.]